MRHDFLNLATSDTDMHSFSRIHRLAPLSKVLRRVPPSSRHSLRPQEPRVIASVESPNQTHSVKSAVRACAVRVRMLRTKVLVCLKHCLYAYHISKYTGKYTRRFPSKSFHLTSQVFEARPLLAPCSCILGVIHDDFETVGQYLYSEDMSDVQNGCCD